MKRLTLSATLTALSIVFVMSSCFVDYSTDIDDLGGSEEPQITTFSPEISGEYVTFKGDVVSKSENQEMAVGFFWYDPNDEQSTEEPNRIDVGVAVGSTTYSTVVTQLPAGKELVVCAFVDRGGVEEMTIGDEVTFVLP
ncbi:MAG: hypothetical protein WBA74_27630 [Cyclobacteriaceae bacterium]